MNWKFILNEFKVEPRVVSDKSALLNELIVFCCVK